MDSDRPRIHASCDNWKQTANSSDQCFVAMWFDNDLTTAWENGFRSAIEKAGYKPLRIDQKHHLNKICDEIIAEIRRSKFVVADYTGHRGGVYYEVGYAAGRGLPVVHTCKKDDMDKLHFDIRQYNCIDWSSPEDLEDRLQDRLEAMFGDGRRQPPSARGGHRRGWRLHRRTLHTAQRGRYKSRPFGGDCDARTVCAR
jgi:nucleoside 2-deoxyribosyltransferase